MVGYHEPRSKVAGVRGQIFNSSLLQLVIICLAERTNRNADRTAVVLGKEGEAFFLVDVGDDPIVSGNGRSIEGVSGAGFDAQPAFLAVSGDPIVVMTFGEGQIGDIGMDSGYSYPRAEFLGDAQAMQTKVPQSCLDRHGGMQSEAVSGWDGMAGKASSAQP